MNVAAGDTAILVKPVFPENQDRICTVGERIPALEENFGGIWWLCVFSHPIKTEHGELPFATIEDFRLRRITGPSVPVMDQTETDIKVPA